MPPKSKIKTLPPEIRQEVDRLLAEGRHGVREIAAHLKGLGADVSKSSVGRYAQEFEEVAARMREGREIAAAFSRELGAIPEGDMGRVLVEMVHHLAFKVLMAESQGDAPTIDSKELMQLARAIKDAGAVTKTSVELELKLRKEVAVKAEAAAEEATKEIRKAGLSSEVEERIRRNILGIAA